MRKKQLAGSAIYWLVVSKQYIDNDPNLHAFKTRREAEHFVDHRVEGWNGWRLLQCNAFAEHAPLDFAS